MFDASGSLAFAPESVPRRMAAAFFFKKGCRECVEVKAMLDVLRSRYPMLQVRSYDIGEREAMRLNEALSIAVNLAEHKRLVTPAIFTAAGALVAGDIKFGPLLELIVSAEGKPAPWDTAAALADEEAARSISERFRSFGLLAVLSAGLTDGINPCAFTTIIFIMSYLALRKRSRREVALTGVAFTAGVFIAYFLVGLGLLEAIQALSFMPMLSRAVFFGTALLTLAAAALSIVDGILALKGREGDMLLSLPGFMRRRIQDVVREGTRSRWIVLSAFAGGAVISILELACTGQVYAPTIVFMTRLGEERLRAYSYLVLYNLMFIVPLGAVFVVTLLGVSSSRLGALFKRHLAAVKFLLAGLFIVLAGLMLMM